MKKSVLKANLCYRFYTSDGWSREEVSNLINLDKLRDLKGTSNSLKFVIPRYYDLDKDQEILKLMDRGFEYNKNDEHKDCDYFAIHNLYVENFLNLENVNIRY